MNNRLCNIVENFTKALKIRSSPGPLCSRKYAITYNKSGETKSNSKEAQYNNRLQYESIE